MMLAAENLTLARGGSRILEHVSLALRPGEVVGLLGANGAGKSTLLGALSSELAPDGGRVTLGDADLAQLPHREQARRRAVLPQKPGLTFDLDVREVVAMGAYPFPELSPAAVDGLVEQALGQADVKHLRARRYPELSGGEQQRVQFARVLVQCNAARAPREPRYLLLDEPTASLDPKHQGDLLRAAAELAHAGDTGVLVILHDMNLAARYADHVFAMREGRVVASGAPQEVMTTALIREVFDLHCEVIADPVSGTPLVLPRGRRHTRPTQPTVPVPDSGADLR